MANFDFPQEWAKRPWWMNLLFGFCLYMTFIYLPFDLFWKSVADDQEVWFGFLLEGWAAKATEPIHWAIYGAGAFGFWKMKSWMWPWASLYSLQVAIGMMVWSLVDDRGSPMFGLVAFGVFMIPTIALYRAKATFANKVEDVNEVEDVNTVVEPASGSS